MSAEIPSKGPFSYRLLEGHVFSGVDKQLHSVDDQPAIVYANGTKWWYDRDKVSRAGDKPAVVCHNGVEEWWVDGQRHREGGKPAVIYPDTADIHPDSRGVDQWWVNGVLVKQAKRA